LIAIDRVNDKIAITVKYNIYKKFSGAKKMKIKKILFYLLAGMLGACVPVMSLHPLYTDKDVVFEEKILGRWFGEEEGNIFEFSRSEESPKRYQLIFTDKEGQKGQFEAQLVKLEDKLFLDIYPEEFACDIEDANKAEWFYNAFFFIPAHTFAKVDYKEPKLKLTLTDDEKMKELLEADPNAVKFESVDDGVILTASPKELQKFVLKYADDERLFSEEIELVRKKAKDPNEAGKKKD